MTIEELLALLLRRDSRDGAWAVYPNGNGAGGADEWEVEFFGLGYAGPREKGCGDWSVAAPTLRDALGLALNHP